MNLADITPVIITYNEALNIGRCLEKLTWAKDIVVVDSFSTDETLAIVGKYPQSRVFQRSFDSHSEQWNFAISGTGVKSIWVLALDADYILTDGFISEIKELGVQDDVEGYNAAFRYKINGRVLRASIYPPVTVLYRKTAAFYEQDGHTQRVFLKGKKQALKNTIFHDDRKSFQRWISSQKKYAKEEALKLGSTKWARLNWKDRIRKLVFPAPVLIFLFGLFGKGLVLDGRAGIAYCGQRLIAEALLSWAIMKQMMCNRTKQP